jgi:hypothetical protein
MIKGKEGLGFVAESSKKGNLELVAEPSKKKKNNKKNKKKKPTATPLLMFLLTFVTQRRSGWSSR